MKKHITIFSSLLLLSLSSCFQPINDSTTSSENPVSTSVEPSSESENSSSEGSSVEESSSQPHIDPDKCTHNYHIDKKLKPTETTDGLLVEQCGLCNNKRETTIPKLDSTSYTVTPLTTNCEHGNGHRYSSDTYGTYDVTDDTRTLHSDYGTVCEYCHKQIGEFNFTDVGTVNCLGYPRLYQLSEYWNNAWLLGGDDGTIKVRRSTNKGTSWSSQVIASFMNGYSCANVDFFELPNHDIICSFRAIGNDDGSGNVVTNRKYRRKLHFSISKDGGASWQDGEDIVDNYEIAPVYNKTEQFAFETMRAEGRLGFFEPYVDLINNVPTVVYADDYTTALTRGDKTVTYAYKTQYLMAQTYDMESNSFSSDRKILIDGSANKSPTGSGLKARISRDGMPVFDRMSDGTYVMVYEGTYRDNDYNTLTGETLSEAHPFEIMMSYSKDGITWSNPVEIYTPHNNLSKSSAPFVCVTDDDQLIISFQTDEDAVPTYVGDAYSVMKCIISKPGIAIEEINRDSFYSVTNVNNTPVGGSSLWNGMMYTDGKIYCCSSGCVVRCSEIPLYADPNDYSVHVDGDAHPIATNNSSLFTSYTSNGSYNPTFSASGISLDNEIACEQKVIINDTNMPNEYQVDFTISSIAARDVNGGLYIGATNPSNSTDAINAININFERAVNSKIWSVKGYKFNQGYDGNFATKTGINSDKYDINVRIVVKDDNVKVCINDNHYALLNTTIPSGYISTGLIGFRNQGTSKFVVSDIVLTY